MPRRRRKNSSSQRKPSLIFTESPLNLTRDTVSPVRCANHPQTAKVIPVEDLADLTWVSPQFQGAPASGRRRGGRRGNLSRSSVITRSRISQSKGKENLQCSFGTRRKLLQGFVPLRFELDKSVEITEIEDVSDVDGECDLNFTKNADFDHASFNSSVVATPPNADPCDRQCHKQKKVETSTNSSPRFHLNLATLNSRCKASRGQNSKGCDSVEGHGNFSEPSPRIRHLRRSARLRDKYHEAVELLRSPMRPDFKETKQCTVLVLDTPESEYGLSRYHQRLKPRKIPPKFVD